MRNLGATAPCNMDGAGNEKIRRLMAEEFVVDSVVRRLEKDRGFSLCLHDQRGTLQRTERSE